MNIKVEYHMSNGLDKSIHITIFVAAGTTKLPENRKFVRR